VLLLQSFLLLTLPLAARAQHTPLQATLARFETRLASDVAADSIGSISAAVFHRERILWARSFGWASVDPPRPAETDFIYRTGSISKSFTAVLLMLLVQDGLVALDDPVERHLPELSALADRPEGAAPITFRHLASHTSGLIREPRLQGAAAGPIELWEEKVLASLPHTSFQSAPGERYSYSNIGFGILGLALSRAANRPFMELVEERIFSPLGMVDSAFIVPPSNRLRLAAGYANQRDGRVDADAPAREHAGRGYKVPNGGVYATVADLARFSAALTGTSPASLLTEASRRQMLEVQTPESETGGYGLGFSISTTREGERLVGHGGSVAGYTAHLLVEPESGYGVVLLRNYGSGRTNLGGATRQVLLEILATHRPR